MKILQKCCIIWLLFCANEGSTPNKHVLETLQKIYNSDSTVTLSIMGPVSVKLRARDAKLVHRLIKENYHLALERDLYLCDRSGKTKGVRHILICGKRDTSFYYIGFIFNNWQYKQFLVNYEDVKRPKTLRSANLQGSGRVLIGNFGVVQSDTCIKINLYEYYPIWVDTCKYMPLPRENPAKTRTVVLCR